MDAKPLIFVALGIAGILGYQAYSAKDAAAAEKPKNGNGNGTKPKTPVNEPPPNTPIPPPNPPSGHGTGAWFAYGVWLSSDGVTWSFQKWTDMVWVEPGQRMTDDQMSQISVSATTTPPPFVYQQAWGYPLSGDNATGDKYQGLDVGAWNRVPTDDLINFAPGRGTGEVPDPPVDSPPKSVYVIDLDNLPNGSTILFPDRVQSDLLKTSDPSYVYKYDGTQFVWIVNNSHNVPTIRAAAEYYKFMKLPHMAQYLYDFADEIHRQGKDMEWGPNADLSFDAIKERFGIRYVNLGGTMGRTIGIGNIWP